MIVDDNTNDTNVLKIEEMQDSLNIFLKEYSKFSKKIMKYII